MDKYIFTHFIVKKKIKKSFSQYLPKRKKNPSPATKWVLKGGLKGWKDINKQAECMHAIEATVAESFQML